MNWATVGIPGAMNWAPVWIPGNIPIQHWLTAINNSDEPTISPAIGQSIGHSSKSIIDYTSFSLVAFIHLKDCLLLLIERDGMRRRLLQQC
jgi:hypothetical protein